MEDVRNQLEQVISKIAWHADHDEGRGACDHFTENAVIAVANTGFSSQGKAAVDSIHRVFEGRQYTARHIYTNLVIHEQRDDFVHASNIVTAYLYKGAGPHPANPTIIADLTYDFVREADAQWRVAKRVATFVFGGVDHLHREGG